jgi:DNA-binding SARP family transcriptional activator
VNPGSRTLFIDLGGGEASDGSAAFEVPSSLQPFLAYLSLDRSGGCHRERMIESLWPDLEPDQGRRRLNTAVWRTRTLLGGGRDDVLHASRSGVIALDRTRIEIDVAPTVSALSEQARSAAAHGDRGALERLGRAVLADVEDLLVGCYDEWVMQARHQLHLASVNGLETLMATATRHDDAIAWAELLVRRDPLREDAHRHLIRLYADAGRRADALRQYEICERHLRDDLGVEPLIETTLVAAAVRSGVRPLERDEVHPARVLREIRDAVASCRGAVEQIEQALTLLPMD